ncbi:MAG: thiol:disulfide interchange protein DsbA/DsbL [Pseudomonadales bacterium]|jgi:protein dithiol oxidoreductase (disulfide-forming)|nr:thiol:disulfide interchange protein DsbA/DsbL [Pseudomonadales bacterium]
MKRLMVPTLWRSVLLAVTLCLSAGTVAEESVLGERFVAGTHYEVLEIAVDTRDADKVEVVEMFSYACIHCFNFDPFVKSWHARQPDDVDFYAVPAIFNSDWELLAQAFYTSESLGVTDQVHDRMFEGIHTLNEDLRQAGVLAPIFEELAGVNELDFNAAYKSFSVRSRVQQAKALVRAYKITGVPTMIVNGKYRIDGRMAGGNAKMIEVVDFLVAKERQSQQ